MELEVDLTWLRARIEESVSDLTLYGLGPDGTSEYEVANVDMTDYPNSIAVTLDHVEGKFVSKNDLMQSLLETIAEGVS